MKPDRFININYNAGKARGSLTALLLCSVLAAPVVAEDAGAPVATPSAPQPVAVQNTPAPVSAPTGGSLFLAGVQQPVQTDPLAPVTQLSAASLLSVTPSQPKKWQKHSLITVVVNETSDYESTGKADSEKQQAFNAQIQQMTQLSINKSGTPTASTVGNSAKLPQIQFAYDNNRQNDATNQRTDTLTTRIEAEVVDVKPNGNLVIEATKTIKHDKEVQVFRMTGECASRDVASDDSVLSTQISDLTLSKTTSGDVNNGTKTGWLNHLIDVVNPL